MRSDTDIQNLIPRLIIGGAVVFVGLWLGRMVPTNTVMAGAVVALAFLIFLLVTRPHYFTLLLLFFMFEAFSLVDADSFGRLPGLFRAKDALLFLLLAYTLATAALGATPLREAKRSHLFRALMAFLLFIALQMMRTHFLLGERSMLLFRAGRHFLSYGMALFLIIYFQDAKKWRLLIRFCLFFVFLILFLHILMFFGVKLPMARGGMGDAWMIGAVKFYNPAMCLSFWLFLQAFWAFCSKPSWRRMIYLGLMTVIVMTYSFRALWSGLLAGMFITWLMVPGRVKSRSALLFTVVMISAIVVAVVGIALARKVSVAESFATFVRYASSTVTDVVNTEGSYRSRSLIDAQRIPLIKEHPLLGIGFVSVFGEVALDLWMRGTLPVGTIDTGWIDLMLRLGGIGVLVLGVLYFQIIRVNYRLLRETPASDDIRSSMLANIGYIILISVSSIAAALPSWEPGIATVAIIIAQTMRFESGVDRQTPKPAAAPAEAPIRIVTPMPNQV